MKALLLPVAVTLVCSSAANAETPDAPKAPAWDVAAEGQLGLQLNRLGAQLDLKLRAKRGLYLSDNELFHDNFVTVALSTQVAPVYANAGVQVDVQPASFIKLSGGYHFVGYYGVWGSLRQPTDCAGIAKVAAGDARCDFHPIGFEDEPPGISSTGHRVWGEVTLMGKVGHLIIVGSTRAERWMMNSPGEFWVNELYGVVSRKNDTVISGGGALLYAVLEAEGTRPELLLGAADDLAWAIGPDSVFNRVGPVASLRAPKLGGWREATIQVFVGFYTHERYLRGSPYVAAAVSIATPDFVGH